MQYDSIDILIPFLYPYIYGTKYAREDQERPCDYCDSRVPNHSEKYVEGR
jgi:hypothetical protein